MKRPVIEVVTQIADAKPRVVYIMGTARSGSTLLGTLLGNDPEVFYAGELSAWPALGGASPILRSRPFWEKVRSRVTNRPEGIDSMKRLFEHPLGLAHPIQRRRLGPHYARITQDVLLAVCKESGRSIVVDSSHYPRRAATLRRLLGSNSVRLVFLVRRPSSVTQSFRRTGEKGILGANLYMLVVGTWAWLVYLTHPRSQRAIISYEGLTTDPLSTGARALGRPLAVLDPEELQAPLPFVANRFAKGGEKVKVQAAEPISRLASDRLSDVIQWPLRWAEWAARGKASRTQLVSGSEPSAPRDKRFK